MKFLFDLLPVLLFFIAFKGAAAYPAQAGEFMDAVFGHAAITSSQAPIMLATLVTLAVSLAQMVYLLLRGRRIEPMLGISFAIILLFGGATLWLHDENFIKWKPTILYWVFALILAGGWFLKKRNFVRTLLQTQLSLPEPIWLRLLQAWTIFFVVLGAFNWVVAFSFPTEVWVNFKLFGLMGLTFTFVVGMGVYLAPHLKEATAGKAAEPKP